MARGDRGRRDWFFFAASTPLTSVGARAPAFLAVSSAPPPAAGLSHSSAPVRVSRVRRPSSPHYLSNVPTSAPAVAAQDSAAQ